MLFTLGIGSATSLAGGGVIYLFLVIQSNHVTYRYWLVGLITVIHDKFTTIKKIYITVGVSIFGFSLGLIYVTPGGLWMVQLVDYFGAGAIIYMISILELIGVIYVYGMPSIVRDIQFMLGRKISLYWQYCWVLSPIVLLAALIADLSTRESFSYGKGQYYPTIALGKEIFMLLQTVKLTKTFSVWLASGCNCGLYAALICLAWNITTGI